MIGVITLGIAGIVFLLGVIVAQLGKDYGTAGALGIGIVFVASLALSGLIGLAALTSF